MMILMLFIYYGNALLDDVIGRIEKRNVDQGTESEFYPNSVSDAH